MPDESLEQSGSAYTKMSVLKGSRIITGEGREDYLTRLCMVVDWRIDHPEYTAKIKVISKKDYPILMLCEF